MPENSSSIADHLGALFKKLDAAKLTPYTILKSKAHKEHYETILMFAFRKLQAARYHLRQVEGHLKAEETHLKKLEKTGPTGKGKLSAVSANVSINSTANEFVYELSAFLAAIRSSIDFLAMACAQHLKGVDAKSMTTLLSLVEKGKTGSILDTIAKDQDWLCQIRDYRDFLVHRLVIGATAGGQVEWKHGQAVTTAYPVIVPSKTPKHVPDTRMARALHEPDQNLIIKTSEGVVTYPDGSQKLLHHSVEMEPAEGYIRIEDLMKRELEAFEAFFVRILDELSKLDFASVSLKAPAPPVTSG